MGRDIKITVVGDTSVGKTSLLISYTTNSFPSEHVPTVFDNYSANAIVDDESITLGLWDTAGSAEFNELRPLSYPGTDAFIVCYSIIDINSLQCVQAKWVPEISQHCPGCPIILVGTKLDLRSKPEAHSGGLVSVQDAEKMAKQINAVTLIECSALTQEKLADVFQQTIRAVINPAKLKDDKISKVKSNSGKASKTPNKEGKDKKEKKDKEKKDKKDGFFGSSKKKAGEKKEKK